MFNKILPQEFAFYDYFEQHAALSLEACQELLQLAKNDGKIEEHLKKINDYELRLDEITHRCMEALHRTFITPIDRTEIHRLIKRMDDIVDCINGALERMVMFEITHMRPEIEKIAEILVESLKSVSVALTGLRNIKNYEHIKVECIKIRELEDEADHIFNNALIELFHEKDPIYIIKWKEIYEIFEKSVDRCEDVANIIENIVIASV
jgi:uncharacterized protein Yka (UPF0111/DUF47 family)